MTLQKSTQVIAHHLLEDVRQSTPPGRQSRQLGALLVDVVPVQLPPASIDIDLGDLEPTLAFPEVAADPEEANNEEGQVAEEKVLCSSGGTVSTDGRNGNVELCNVSELTQVM